MKTMQTGTRSEREWVALSSFDLDLKGCQKRRRCLPGKRHGWFRVEASEMNGGELTRHEAAPYWSLAAIS